MDSIFHKGGQQRLVTSQNWHSEIMAGGYRGVIFDCDGTLVDSSETHFQSFWTALNAQGQDLQRDWYRKRTGLDRQSLIAAFADEVSDPVDVPAAIQKSIDNFIELSASVTAVPETAALVRALRPSHPMAIGTNAEQEVAAASLTATGLRDYFDCIVSISDKVAAKPAPEIFLQATKNLGFAAPETVVFEDSAEGVRAALSAGLDVFQVID